VDILNNKGVLIMQFFGKNDMEKFLDFLKEYNKTNKEVLKIVFGDTNSPVAAISDKDGKAIASIVLK